MSSWSVVETHINAQTHIHTVTGIFVQYACACVCALSETCWGGESEWEVFSLWLYYAQRAQSWSNEMYEHWARLNLLLLFVKSKISINTKCELETIQKNSSTYWVYHSLSKCEMHKNNETNAEIGTKNIVNEWDRNNDSYKTQNKTIFTSFFRLQFDCSQFCQ